MWTQFLFLQSVASGLENVMGNNYQRSDSLSKVRNVLTIFTGKGEINGGKEELEQRYSRMQRRAVFIQPFCSSALLPTLPPIVQSLDNTFDPSIRPRNAFATCTLAGTGLSL
jgi:hypothetical protein